MLNAQRCSQNKVRYSPGVKHFVWSSVYSDYGLYHLPMIGSDDSWFAKPRNPKP